MQTLQAKLGPYAFTFHPTSGAWLSLSCNGITYLNGNNNLPEITLITDGVTTVSTGRGHLDNIRNAIPIGAHFALRDFQTAPQSITLVLQEADWTITETFLYCSQKDRIERNVEVCYSGQEESLLRFALFNLPVFHRETLQTLEMPGYNGVLHQSLGELPVGRYPLALDGADVDGVNWRPGVLALEGQGNSLLLWLYGQEMPAIWQLYNGKSGAWAESKWICCCRMKNGSRLCIGTQYLKPTSMPILQALDCIRPFWREVGLYPKQPAQDWVGSAFIYEVQIGPKSSLGGKVHNPYPTPKALTQDLARIHDLGFTVIELMPHFPYPAYSVSDYFDIDLCYGNRDQLLELIHAAHKLGMRIFLDVVMHGVSDQAISPQAPYKHHPLLDEHPEYFLKTEDGQVARTYTWSFDQANPALRKYIQQVFCHYVSTLDVDGFRVDALTWNYFPNWEKGLSYPGYKSIDGCFQLFQAVRDAVWALKPGIAFYSETTGPLMARSFDLSYNYDEVWLYETLLPLQSWAQTTGNWNLLPQGKRVNAREAAEWLELRQKVLPENWVKVHHADSHDTYEWGGLGAFRRESMGTQQACALFAYCCFVEGAVMNYVGGEYGLQDSYRALISARKQHPALQHGSCLYTAVRAENPNLLFLLRRSAEETLLPVINFSQEAVCSPISLDNCGLDPMRPWLLREHFSGKQLLLEPEQALTFTLQIAGLGYQLWEVLPK